MFALSELLKDRPGVGLSLGHPGITVTNISAHYPKPVWALLRLPMKLIFMNNRKAVRGILLGLGRPLPPLHWIGPRFFGIWGNPAVKKLDTCSPAERQQIFRSAENIYKSMDSH